MRKNGNHVSSGGAKVTVACKIPLGVSIHVVEQWNERLVETPGGNKTVKESRMGEPVHILGPGYPNGQVPEGYREKPPIVGGFALTHGVSKDFWDQWWSENADPRCKPEEMHHEHGCRCTMIVKSRMIFAYETTADTRAAAVEAKHLNSGLEPLRGDGDYRAPRPLAGISQIKPERAPLPNDA